MSRISVEIHGEGCLDIALGYYIVANSSEHGIDILDTALHRGWKDTIEFVIRRLENYVAGDGLSPRRTIVFIDADYSLTERLNEIKGILSDSKISNFVEIREVYPPSARTQEDILYPLGLELSLKDEQDVKVLIILWAVEKDEIILSGIVEDVIKSMLSEAYDCPIDTIIDKLSSLASCSKCPNKVSKMVSVFEKLMPMILLASCAGTGTLVSVHGAVPDDVELGDVDFTGPEPDRCGLPVLDALEGLDKLKDTVAFRRYSMIIKRFLSGE